MELRVTLAQDGGLRLILPTGRPLDVGNTPQALTYIKRILMDVRSGRKEQPGYINEFPTQHVIEIWKKEDARKRIEAEKDKFKDMGINLDKLEISL